jgi:hypothetical protein
VKREEVVAFIRRVSYKPDWTIAVMSKDYAPHGLVCMRISFLAPDATNPNAPVETQVCGQEIFDPYMIANEEQLKHMVFRVFKRAEDHELREFFKVDGVAPFDPHR